uniref:Uncharacterized protein n=1 Tax=Acrobeloides nanus TaxID=290746 RepID=A0A914C8X9_9BILA
MNIMTELFDVTNQTITFISTENGTLELFIASLNYMLLDPNYVAAFYIYDSMFMTNFIGYYQSDMISSQFLLSTTNSLTIYSSNLNKSVWAKFVFRIKEFYENNCFDGIVYLGLGSTIDDDDYTISANSTHECVYSILIPNLVPYSTLLIYEDDAIPVLYIDSMEYEGSSMVTVKTYLNNYTTLFEFDEKDVPLWHSLYLYGDLISFVIPPNGNLR